MTVTIMLFLFFLLMLLGTPIAIAIGASSIISIIFEGQLPGLIVPQRLFVMLDSFSLMAVPLFILSGEAMEAAGITRSIVNFSHTLVRHLRAGLAQVSILANCLLSGITGSAAADASAIGSIMIPAMIDAGYDKEMAVSTVAAGSTVGPIIPPSVMMIIYGSMTGVSIGAMFLGGFIPGLLFGAALMILTNYIARKKHMTTSKRATLKEIGASFKVAFWGLLMPVVVMGGMLTGIFTATEAGAIATIYAFILGFANGKIKLKDLEKIFRNAGRGTAVPMFVIGIAAIFGWVLARNDFPQAVAGALLGISENPYIFVLIILLIYFILGLFMEANAAMIIMVPVITPVAAVFGIDPVHLGVLTVVILCIGSITPPVGLLLFISTSIAKAKFSDTSKAIWPYVIVLTIMTIIIGLVPELVTILPKLIMGN